MRKPIHLLHAACLAALFPLGGCNGNGNATGNEKETIAVDITDYRDRILRQPDFAARIDTIALHTGPYFMGPIVDFCLTDSMLYATDWEGAAWAFSLPSGNLVRRVRRIGHGHGEYASLRAIDAKDSCVYFLDSQSGQVLVNDTRLDFERSFLVEFPALDFAKTDDGFLFCNLMATPQLHRLVHTDDEGRMLDSYLPSGMELDLIYENRTFTQGEDGDTYFAEPYANEVYRWTAQGPQPAFRTDYGKDNLESGLKKGSEAERTGHAFTTSVFVFNDRLVHRFFKEGTTCYSFAPLDGTPALQGRPDTTACIPFGPAGQHADALACLYHTGDLQRWKPQRDSCEAVLVLFHLKRP